MRKVFAVHKRLPTTMVTFIGGCIMSLVVKQGLAHIVNEWNTALSALGILFVVLAVAVVTDARTELVALLREAKLSARVVHASDAPNGDVELYDAVTECLLSAKQSIVAVSLFRPPTLKSSEGRKRYYDALDELLARPRDEHFTYERVIQVDRAYGDELHEDQTDPLTFAHCRRCLERSERGKVSMGIWQTPNTLGSLSFFIVDRKQVVFVIPTKPASGGGDARALPVGSVVIFSDGEGSLVGEMLFLFSTLRNAAKIVHRCVESRSAA